MMHLFGFLSTLVLGVRAHDHDIATLTPPLFPLQQDANSTKLFPMPLCGNFHLEEATIDQMQNAMRTGALTSVQLVICYILRTCQVDEYIK
jgi:amidase